MNDIQKAVLVKMMMKGSLVSHYHGNDGCECVYIYTGKKFKWVVVLTDGIVIK